MKIAIVLESNITSGGGYNQALNAIDQMLKLCKGKYETIVYTPINENIVNLNNLGIKASLFKFGLIDKVNANFLNSSLLSLFQRKLKLYGGFEKKMLKDGCDLVYFLEATNRCLSLRKLNYINTIWDLSHRDSPEFPEVRIDRKFEARENLYKNSLPKAFLVIVDSKTLAKRCSSRYGIDVDKIIDMPFSPSPFFKDECNIEIKDLLIKYSIEEGYYYYPAQFWPHKNHIRILQALVLLKNNKINKKVVFSGGDKGNLSYIKSKILEFGLENNVELLGFVPSSHIKSLYKASLAVVMPTYFGPTNIPPLEAWSLGKPLIYSSHLKENVGDAAILVNPDSAEDLAKAMISVLNPIIVNKLVNKGNIRLNEIELMRRNSEAKLIDKLDAFSMRMDCWNCTVHLTNHNNSKL